MSEIHVSDMGNPLSFKVMYEEQSADKEKDHDAVEKPSLLQACPLPRHDRQGDQTLPERSFHVRISQWIDPS
jgi:hypothetical protein